MITLESALAEMRIKRNFKCARYIANKLEAINKFFTCEQLDSAVVGLSGGVDSAVVYKLLIAASQVPGSPIKQVMGVSIPIYSKGISGQSAAEYRANLLFKSLSDEELKVGCYASVNLTSTAKKFFAEFPMMNDWAHGQAACILRTPVLYGWAANLQTQGFKSLVVGTTNRDEGSYIGFFGKASDAMVDLQPIADIHKSEVYKVAEYLMVQ